jgi:hypothetical protein
VPRGTELGSCSRTRAQAAYCPQKGADAWYQEGVELPWRSLIAAEPSRIEDIEPALGQVVGISIAPDAMGRRSHACSRTPIRSPQAPIVPDLAALAQPGA